MANESSLTNGINDLNAAMANNNVEANRRGAHSSLGYERPHEVAANERISPLRSVASTPEVQMKQEVVDIISPDVVVTMKSVQATPPPLSKAPMSNEGPIHRISFETFGNRMVSTMQTLLQEAHCTDVLLSTGYKSQTIRAHRLVLSAFSPYFKDLFAAVPVSTSAYPIVLMREISHEMLCTIIDFCYRGEIYLHESKLKEFEEAARFLQISGVQEWKVEMAEESGRVPSALDPNHNQISVVVANAAQQKTTVKPKGGRIPKAQMPMPSNKNQQQLQIRRGNMLQPMPNVQRSALEATFESSNWSGSSELSVDDISVSADEEGATTPSTNSSTIGSMASSGSRLLMPGNHHGHHFQAGEPMHARMTGEHAQEDYGRRLGKLAQLDNMQSSPINLKLKNMGNSM